MNFENKKPFAAKILLPLPSVRYAPVWLRCWRCNSGVGPENPPSNAGNQLALRGDALTVNACYTSGVFEAVAGMLTRILREWKTNNWPPDYNPSFVNLSLRFTSQNKQGIGIIFIVNYFATCFADFAGPISLCYYFDIRNECKEENCFHNTCKESDYARSSK